MKSSDETWSTGGENGKPLQYSCRENHINIKTIKKKMTLEDEPPDQKVSIVLLSKSRGQLLIAHERMNHLGQSGNEAQL